MIFLDQIILTAVVVCILSNSHIQKALTKATVGTLWGEDPTPLMACVCVALSLCRLLLSPSGELVTDENKIGHGHSAHNSKADPLSSLNPAQRQFSAALLSAEEEQVTTHHIQLSCPSVYVSQQLIVPHIWVTKVIMRNTFSST